MTLRRPAAGHLVVVLALAQACTDDVQLAGSSDVGARCERDTDCRTGLCYVTRAGGYCTAACEAEGDTAACPRSSVCKPIQGGFIRCLLICGTTAACEGTDCPMDFCPTGSSCAPVANSMLKACEPSP
jgi:hypothetical protein